MKKQQATNPVTSLNQSNEVSQRIADTQKLIDKIKHDYHIAGMIASSALYTINKMSGEIDAVTEQLALLTAVRDGVPLKVLFFNRKEQKQ